MNIIIFGAGASGRMLYDEASRRGNVIAFADNDPNKWGQTICGIPIYEPQKCLLSMEYDTVIVAAFCGLNEIRQQCLELGIPAEKIITSAFETSKESRKMFLKNMASLLNSYESDADVAEAGVYQGEFAQWINYYFPQRTLHLFDTFAGFDAKDLSVEAENNYSEELEGHFKETSVELVMSRMPHPKRCIVHKGYFPDTAAHINRKFCFVNLDLDLYLPIYRGLHYFKNHMTTQGVILIHDYYSSGYKGSRAAVEQFTAECNGIIRKLPIGDDASILLCGEWDKLIPNPVAG